MPQEFDEFGIPIKTESKQNSQVDEFGIPIKKKEASSQGTPTTSTTTGGTTPQQQPPLQQGTQQPVLSKQQISGITDIFEGIKQQKYIDQSEFVKDATLSSDIRQKEEKEKLVKQEVELKQEKVQGIVEQNKNLFESEITEKQYKLEQELKSLYSSFNSNYDTKINQKKSEYEKSVEKINSGKYYTQQEVDAANAEIQRLTDDYNNWLSTINEEYSLETENLKKIEQQKIKEYELWQANREKEYNALASAEIDGVYGVSKQETDSENEETLISKSLQTLKAARTEQIDKQIAKAGIIASSDAVQMPRSERIVTMDVIVPSQEDIVNRYISQNKQYLPLSESDNLEEIAIGVGINKFNEFMSSPEGQSISSVSQKEALKAKYVNEEIKNIQGNIKEEIFKFIPEEKRTTENLKRIEQELWDDYRFGIDLSGDNEWNEKSIIQDFAINTFVSFSKLGGSILLLAAKGSPISLFTNLDEYVEERVSRNNKIANQILEEYSSQSGSMAESIKTGNLFTFAKQSLSVLGQSSAPMLLSSATGFGSLGYAALSVTSGTQTYIDVKDEEWFKKLGDVGKASYIGVIGATEGFSEFIGAKILGNMAENMLKGIAKAPTKKAFTEWFIATSKANGIDMTVDAATEMLPSVTEYVATSLAKGEDITWEGIKENSIEGFLGGLGMVGVTTTVTTGVPTIAYFNNVVKMESLNKKLKKLNEEYSNTTNENERKVLAEEILKVRQNINKSIIEADKLYKRFDEQDKIEYSRKMAELDQAIGVLDKLEAGTTAYSLQKEKADALYNDVVAIEEKYTNQQVTNQQVTSEVQQVVEQFEDDQTVTTTVRSLEEIPEPFRDRAREISKGTKVRKSFLGIPYGKETDAPKAYSYTATGKELKDYFNANKATPPAQATPTQQTQQAETQQVEGEDLSQKSTTIATGKKSIVELKEDRRKEIEKIKKEAEGTREERTKRLSEIKKEFGEEGAIERLNQEISDRANKIIEKLPPIPKTKSEIIDEKSTKDFNKAKKDLNLKDSGKQWGGTPLGEDVGYAMTNESKTSAIFLKPNEIEYYDEAEDSYEEIYDGIKIELVLTKPQNRGGGEAKKLIQKVVDWADLNNVKLSLEVAPQDETTTESGLKKLYSGFGFKFDGINGERLPAPQQTTRDTKQTEIKDDTQAKQQVPSGKQEGKEAGKPQKQKASVEATRSDRDKQAPTEKRKNVRTIELTLNDALIKRIKTTPVFKTMFSKEQMDSLKSGKNTLNVNHTAWGKISRMFGDKAVDVTNVKTEPENKQAPTKEEVKKGEKAGISAKNLRDLYSINRKLWGLDRVKAFANAVVMDRMIGAMAKRAGLTKQEMYGKLEFRRASEKDLPQGVKFQVDAWHGSPYQFDKFTTEKIGTGEGAQAFGWGLYFTDIKEIANDYANKLSKVSTMDNILKKLGVNDTSFRVREELYNYLEDYAKADWLWENIENNYYEGFSEDEIDHLRRFAEYKALNNDKLGIQKNLYKVSLHKGKTPDQYTWLEWDKELDRPLMVKILSAIAKSKNEDFDADKFNSSLRYRTDAYDKYGIRMDEDGKGVYFRLSKALGGDKQASLFLLENGIDGIKYPAESISRGATSDTARGFNYVVFDENAVSIEEVIKFQKDAVKARGAMMMAMDGKAIIYALEDPNVSTPLHELAHVFEHYLTEAERNSVLKWANSKEWTVDVSEKFARGFEKFLADGKAPTANLQKIFNKFKEWLTDIYNGITNSEIDIKLNKPMQDIYSRMLGEETQAPTEKEVEASYDLKNKKEIDTGGTGEAIKQDRKDTIEASDSDKIRRMISETTSDRVKEVLRAVLNAVRATMKILPSDFKIYVVTSNEEFSRITGESVEEIKKDEYGGFFDTDENAVYINLSEANLKTVAHEMFHAILFNALGKNDELVRIATYNMIKSLRGALSGSIPSIIDKKVKELEEAVKKGVYEKNEINEEALGRLFEIIAARYTKLNPNIKQKIKVAINKFLSFVGLDAFRIKSADTDQSVIDFFRTVPQMLIKGEVISELDIDFSYAIDKVSEDSQDLEKTNQIKKAEEPSTNKKSVKTNTQEAEETKNMFAEQEDALFEASKKNRDFSKTFWNKWFDRQSNIRKALTEANAKLARAIMTTKAGAIVSADRAFKKIEKVIYGGLSLEEEKLMDMILFHERVIQIDSNFDAKESVRDAEAAYWENEAETVKNTNPSLAKKYKRKAKEVREQQRPKHPRGFNKERSEAALEGLKEDFGDVVYDKVYERAQMVFEQFNKIMEKMYEFGLVDKGTYDRFKNDKYIPRQFLHHLFAKQVVNSAQGTGLRSAQIQAIDGGSEELAFMDSRILLSSAMRSLSNRKFQNDANNALAAVLKKMGELPWLREANYEYDKKTGLPKVDAYGNKVVKDADRGFVNVNFFVDGKRDSFQMSEELYQEWMDIQEYTDPAWGKFLRTALLTDVIKTFATRQNPAFFIANVPIDYTNVILFTDIYDDKAFLGSAMFDLAKRFTKMASGVAAINGRQIAGMKESDKSYVQKLFNEAIEHGLMMEFLSVYGKPDEMFLRDKAKKEGKIRKGISLLGEKVSESLSFTGEVSEVAMRLSVYEKIREDLIKASGKTESQLTKQEMDEIAYQAAEKARNTIDFSQGGRNAKKIDVFFAYFNAAAQSFRISSTYIKNNPKKFASKMMQMAMPVAALMLYNMMVGDDDDWEEISEFEKKMYFIILSPLKGEDGKRKYIKIRKHPQAAPFFNIIEYAVMSTAGKQIGKNWSDDLDFGKETVRSFNDAMPFPTGLDIDDGRLFFNPSEALAKTPPAIQALTGYVANFDMFRGEQITRDKDVFDIEQEGYFDKHIPIFYKEMGERMGMSPARSKMAVEKVITTPSTNVIVGMTYTVLDAATTAFVGNDKYTQVPSDYVGVENIGKSFTRKFIGETKPYLKEGKIAEMGKKFELQENFKSEKQRQTIRYFIEESKSFSEYKANVKKYIKEDVPLDDKMTIVNYAQTAWRTKEYKSTMPMYYKYMDVMFTKDTEAAAMKLALFLKNADVKSEDFKTAAKEMSKLGFTFNNRFLMAYNNFTRANSK